MKTYTVYILLTFPLFYFAYKYGSPDFGLKDFHDYYKLYSNWDLKDVEAPFNMRLLSTWFVYVLNKLGLHYDTATAFDATGLNRQVFFNALFFNFLSVAATCTVLFFTLKRFFGNTLLAFCGGMLYLLGFGTLFYEIMPITDAFSVLLFAIILHFYLLRSRLILIPLLLLILQREYIFLALGLVAALDLWKQRDRYYLHVLVYCILCFVIYMVLRKTLFYTPKYDHQASAGYFMQMFTELRFPLLPYLKQTLMTMNLFILYVLVLFYKKFKKIPIDAFGFWKLFLLFLQINFISFAAVFGNNTGRYFYILVPLVIYELVKESYPLINDASIRNP